MCVCVCVCVRKRRTKPVSLEGLSPYLTAIHICRTEVLSISNLSPVGSNISVLYQQLYIQSKRVPEDGRVCRPKRVQQIQIVQ